MAAIEPPDFDRAILQCQWRRLHTPPSDLPVKLILQDSIGVWEKICAVVQTAEVVTTNAIPW
jgi:hypothetical protein